MPRDSKRTAKDVSGPRGLHRYRRFFQVASLVVFFVLLTLTVWPLGSVFLGTFLVADPLIAINSAAGGVLRWEMVLAVVMIAAPLIVGRAFCGYACPMGFLVETLGPKDGRTGPRWLRTVPVFVLIASAGLLLFGSAAFLVLDPLALLTRSATTLAYPAVDRFARVAGDIAYLAVQARPAVDAVTAFLAGRIIFARPLAYQMAFGIFAMFAAILGLSFVERRLWCRHLCPLGALLGTVGRLAVFGRVVDEDRCTSCGACQRACPLGAIPGPAKGGGPGEGDARGKSYLATDTTRCQLGFECADACPNGAIHLGMRPPKDNYIPSRRALLVAGGFSLLGGFFVFDSIARQQRNVRLIRPPGGVAETAFLGLCSRCAQCVKVCPTNVIQPSVTAAGLEGVFTPQMDYRHGFCDWACNECGKVCPTGAIRRLSLPVKRRTKIGRAYIDKNRCIPWTDFKNCLVCQELCPLPEKAVAVHEETVTDPFGKAVTLKRPMVIRDRCIGCGVCEYNCPVAHEAAIQVRAIL